jgi:hypothetical protein
MINVNWQGSPAHMLFLSKFLSRKTIDYYDMREEWKAALGEHPQEAIKRYLDDDMIKYSDLHDLLDYKYKVPELKVMCKERDLPVSGRKGDLINRVIQANPEAAQNAVRGLKVLQCNEKGSVVAKQYLACEEEKRKSVELQVLEALQNGKLKEACLIAASHEAEQVLPRFSFGSGQGNDPIRDKEKWKNYNSTEDLAFLNLIFQNRPKLLARLTEDQLRAVRIMAGMQYLCGYVETNLLPDDFKTELPIDNEMLPEMIYNYAKHQTDMDDYRKSGITQIEILTCGPNDPSCCPACQKLGKKKYKIDEVPELPYEKCTSNLGCRCVTDSVVF